jgi:hypothetical protein
MEGMLSRLLLLAGLAILPLAAADGVDAAWKNLQSLDGEWTGDGGKTAVTYTIVSNGTVVMERMKMPSPQPDMVTMYHRDGAALVATHYCSIGNQPRMRASEADAKTIRFRFLDITNLTKPEDGHINDLTVTFRDKDHFTQEWTSVAAGKSSVHKFEWTRKR